MFFKFYILYIQQQQQQQQEQQPFPPLSRTDKMVVRAQFSYGMLGLNLQQLKNSHHEFIIYSILVRIWGAVIFFFLLTLKFCFLIWILAKPHLNNGLQIIFTKCWILKMIKTRQLDLLKLSKKIETFLLYPPWKKG